MSSADEFKAVIEAGIWPVVKALRDAGINTECSCEHEMYVQCQTLDPTEDIRTIYNVLVGELGINTYTVSIENRVDDGHQYPTLDIRLPKP